MTWHIAGLVWIALVFFWGLGLTLLAVPRRWQRFWPAFCGPVGLALQSLVVWIGTHTAVRGTDRYGKAALLLPVLLFVVAWWRGRLTGNGLLAGLWRWAAVFALMAASLVVQCYPFTKPPGKLTAIALSSCDAADYAAGARVFKEFSRDDREGFLGDNGRDPMISADRFFTFWLRINHFSPSALVALHATLSGRQPYELVSLCGAVLLALGLPGVFWLARSAFGFRPAGALGVAAIYGFSPIPYYAMYQTALGQLLAAAAVALLTWTGWQAYRAARAPLPASWRRLAGWSGLLFVGNWLLLGGYNFFVLFAYIPILTLVGVNTLRTLRWGQAGRWAGLIAANLALCAVLFPERFISIAERFRLFRQTAFGWSIPGFWPTGWYGAFGDLAALTPAHSPLIAAVAGVALAAAVGSALWQARRGRWQTSLLAAGCTLPILGGYWYLLRQETLHHDRSSYDAFKLFTVFYPGLLISLCLWLRGGRRPGAHAWLARAAAAVLWATLLAINLAGIGRFNFFLRKTPLIVGPDLVSLAAVESMPDVAAVNIRLPLVWDALWANAFLLRKLQYIPLPTYEGRPVLPPRGRWDLTPRFPSARLDGVRDPLAANSTYTLLDRASAQFVDVRMDRDWYPIERYRDGTWFWSKEHPQIRIDNPHEGPLPARLHVAIHSTRERHLSLYAGERPLWEGTVGKALQDIDGVALDLPPGTTYVRFVSPEPPEQPPGDTRALTLRLEGFTVEMPEPAPPAAAQLQ